MAAAAIALSAVVCPSSALAELPEHIRHFEIARARSQRSATSDGARRMSLTALGRTFDLVLEPSKVLSPNARTITVSASGTRVEPTTNSLYRGYLADDIEAEVRVSDASGALDGYVRTHEEIYYLEPLSRYERTAEADAMVVYRASDIDPDAVPPSDCGAAHAAGAGSSTNRAVARSHGQSTGLLELTLVADYAFTQTHANPGAYIQNIINQVDGFYVEDLGVTLLIVDTILYTSPGIEPFSTTTSPSSLLDEVASARMNDIDGAGAGGLTHLFTGRDLDGMVIGIAYIDSLCASYYGSGLSQSFTPDNHLMTLLVGHELGHNFGAYHDGQSGSPCSGTSYGFVMWPSLSMELQEGFSQCSIDTIEPAVSSASCITPAIPPGCGDGIVGVGEDCDDGNNLNGDCCRLDCKFAVSGSQCQSDGNECTDDVCNGLGVCNHPFNNAPCDDGDVCTFDGMCAFGSCQPLPNNDRPLIDYRMKASIGPVEEDDKMSFKAAAYIPDMTSPPDVGGLTLELRDQSDAIVYEAFIPADQWQDLTGNGTTFRYRNEGAAPPETAGIRSMLLKYRPSSGVAKLKGKGELQELETLMGATSLTARLQVGDNLHGVCAQAFELACEYKGTQITCP
ncbi:MAG TPA: zinc-dependent metalloprotease family protein [Candidatus Limnocylindrales bacterium]|nr:zinc-dependent metalloprotease family protein [Candidatus Limnocylindrales bacterium]